MSKSSCLSRDNLCDVAVIDGGILVEIYRVKNFARIFVI